MLYRRVIKAANFFLSFSFKGNKNVMELCIVMYRVFLSIRLKKVLMYVNFYGSTFYLIVAIMLHTAGR